MPHLLKKIQLLWRFYRSYLFASLLVDACCVVLAYEYGFGILEMLFAVKFLGMSIIIWFINSSGKERFYYYHNLGLSKDAIWYITLGFDSALFISLILLTLHYRL